MGVGGSWIVGVSVVDSFEFCSTFFSYGHIVIPYTKSETTPPKDVVAF